MLVHPAVAASFSAFCNLVKAVGKGNSRANILGLTPACCFLGMSWQQAFIKLLHLQGQGWEGSS